MHLYLDVFCTHTELRMDWLNGGPPDQIEVGVRLNVSYHATILSYSPTPVPFQGFNMKYVPKSHSDAAGY